MAIGENSLNPPERISFEQRLKQFEEQLRNGEKVAPITVRELLRWRGWERRGSFVNSLIQRALQEANLTTLPDFTIPYIDALVEFRLLDNVDGGADSAPPSTSTTASVDADPIVANGIATSVSTT